MQARSYAAEKGAISRLGILAYGSLHQRRPEQAKCRRLGLRQASCRRAAQLPLGQAGRADEGLLNDPPQDQRRDPPQSLRPCRAAGRFRRIADLPGRILTVAHISSFTIRCGTVHLEAPAFPYRGPFYNA